jgi:hypothetical protein
MVTSASNVSDRIRGPIVAIPFPCRLTIVPSATFSTTGRRWAMSPCTKGGMALIARVRSEANDTGFSFGLFGVETRRTCTGPCRSCETSSGNHNSQAEEWSPDGDWGFGLICDVFVFGSKADASWLPIGSYRPRSGLIDRSARPYGSSRDVPPRPEQNVRRWIGRMSGTEDHDVYWVKQKFVRLWKPDERIRIGAWRSVHLPVPDKQSELSTIPWRDHAHSQAVIVCKDCSRCRPRAERFRQFRLKSAPAPAYSRSAWSPR